jgi:hypothetical protein
MNAVHDAARVSYLHDKAKRDLGPVLSELGGGAVPAGFDVVALKDDLDWAGTLYRIRTKLAEAPRRRKKLEELANAVKRLRRCIDEDVRYELPHIDEMVAAITDALEASLKRRAKEPDWAAEAARKFQHEVGMDARSAAEWLAGDHLVKIYERHFGNRAGYSRRIGGSRRNPDEEDWIAGRYINFAEAAFQYLKIFPRGKPFSRTAIAAALTKCRAGKARRRATGK